ncbi:MAG: hypothetical protein H7Y60_07910 [Rhodospirillaceae bacterium]|nr:hypothetical protein [Rhodospirillales bacterium]
MSVQWIRRDHRLDMDLAIGLETGANLLVRAKSARQLDEAVTFNLRLWRGIRAVALCCPGMGEREFLIGTADHVASMLALDAYPSVDPRDMAFVAGRNMALAGDLAAAQVAERYRDSLVAEWAAQNGPHRFEAWLLERLQRASSL